MIKIDVKPLSVNEAWKGRRFKTDKYDRYITTVLALLPNMELPRPPYKLSLEFGFSNSASDVDNPIKNFTDCLQKRYKFNDRDIYILHVNKVLVKKTKEYVKFELVSI